MERWRGLKALVHDAVHATAELVREGHDSTHRGVRRIAGRLEPASGPVQALSHAVQLGTAGTVRSVQVVNRVVQELTDIALDGAVPLHVAAAAPPIPLRSDGIGSPEWIGDASLAAVNGAIGHHLAATGNGLDLGLQLRHGDRYLEPSHPANLGGTVVVLVHGLGTTEWCWSLQAESVFGDPAATYGSMLERDRGLQPVFVRYNTGRRVFDNGRLLAEALEHHLAGVDRVVLLGHSMGGLVARAACQSAKDAGHRWLDAVDLAISLGTPHQGAGLARFGQRAAVGLDAIDLPATRIASRILAGRSAGVRDLEHGDVADLGPDPDASADPADRVVPLLEGIRYAFLSATAVDREHPAADLLGDLMVHVGSASRPAGHETFPIHTGTLGGVMHFQLQCHPDVYEVVRALAGP